MQLSSFRLFTSAGSLNVFHSREDEFVASEVCHTSAFSDTETDQSLSILNQTTKMNSDLLFLIVSL